MKIAFCLHGLASGKNFKFGGLPVTFNNEADLFHKYLIDNNDVDSFYHTWKSEDDDQSQQVFECYLPKKYKVEAVKTFKPPTLREYLKYFSRRLRGRKKLELQRVNNIYSRWYSFRQAIELVREYEKETGTKYDYIFITRFDMSLFRNIEFESMKPTNFYCGDWYHFFDKEGRKIHEHFLFENPNKVSKSVDGYPKNNNGISDFWFCASPEMMEEFSKIYYELGDLIKHAGKSNHCIAQEKLKRMDMLGNLSKMLEFGRDYYLTRWIANTVSE